MADTQQDKPQTEQSEAEKKRGNGQAYADEQDLDLAADDTL
jgi:hypothetical protein